MKSPLVESDAVDVTFRGLCGHALDAISIHRAGVNGASSSEVQSRYTNGRVSGTVRLGPLDAGVYEVRAMLRRR